MDRPIFIIGCPRSGTTITMEIMALHEQLSWVSNYLNRIPQKPILSALNRVYDLPLLGKNLYHFAINDSRLPRKIKRYFPSPVEPWKFWNSYLSNFQWDKAGKTDSRRRVPDDISVQEIRYIRETIKSIKRAAGKPRFLSKYTDFPRMKYLTQAFPGAQFIHIIRDGRAVAASYHKLVESGQFGTWGELEWWIKGWPKEWQDQWNHQHGTQLSFVAFQWKFFVREILQDAKEIPPTQYLEVNYKDLTSSPGEVFNQIFDFCQLKPSPKVDWYLKNINLTNMNQKWQQRYSESEKRALESIIHEPEFRKLLD